MNIIKLETKNTKTLAVLTSIGFLGVVVLVWMSKAGHFDYAFGTELPNQYLLALQPILYVGIPIVLIISFLLGVFTATREDLPVARLQGAVLSIVVLLLAYVFSFNFTGLY